MKALGAGHTAIVADVSTAEGADAAVDGNYTVIWTIQWTVATNFNVNKFGVLHFQDGASTPDLKLTYKKDLCKTASQVGCIGQ